MDTSRYVRATAAAGLLALLTACATAPGSRSEASMFPDIRVTEHRGEDDLLTAGLGLKGLRVPTPPVFATPGTPTPAELRRRALWSNWRGIADLSPSGGYGTLYGSVAAVPGREFQAFATLPGARHPHRVLLQAPDAFDAQKRCLVVSASSGSRGIYGAIAVAGAWGLPNGCAVAYTDKGAGTDYFDLDAQSGVRLDGTPGTPDDGLAFVPETGATPGVAFKHAHSGDNPEADWGRHVKQAAEFGLHALGQAYPQLTPFTFDNTRVIAVGISNGGGAVLRAAELDGDWLDAVVAGEPNVFADAPGARTLYDVSTEAALLMPCALAHLGMPASPAATAHCDAMAAQGLLAGSDAAARHRAAYDALRARGWTDDALRGGSISVAFDLWRAVAATYAQAYGRYPAGEHPCGYGFAALGPDGRPRAATAAERAAWWSDSSGIPPGAGVMLVDPKPQAPLDGLRCLRALWDGQGADAKRVRDGIARTEAAAPREGLPVFVVHGLDDGLIPAAFTSTPYVAMAREAGRDVRYWRVHRAQHFDAFLGLPQYGARYVPMLPYVYRALDSVWSHLNAGTPLPGDAEIAASRRAGEALDARDLAVPR